MTSAEYEAQWFSSLTDSQRQLFLVEMTRVRKSPTAGILLALFLGGFGAHRFYLNDLWGLLYVGFCWALLPAIVALIEAFAMRDRVESYNMQRAAEIGARIKAYAPAGGERR